MHLLPHWPPRTEALLRKAIHWFRCNFMLPTSYALPQLPSLGLRALCYAYSPSTQCLGCICLTHLSPFLLSSLSPNTACMLALPRLLLWWAKWSHGRKSEKQINLHWREPNLMCFISDTPLALYQGNHVLSSLRYTQSHAAQTLYTCCNKTQKLEALLVRDESVHVN